jgi:hypothetical protein
MKRPINFCKSTKSVFNHWTTGFAAATAAPATGAAIASRGYITVEFAASALV